MGVYRKTDGEIKECTPYVRKDGMVEIPERAYIKLQGDRKKFWHKAGNKVLGLRMRKIYSNLDTTDLNLYLPKQNLLLSKSLAYVGDIGTIQLYKNNRISVSDYGVPIPREIATINWYNKTVVNKDENVDTIVISGSTENQTEVWELNSDLVLRKIPYNVSTPDPLAIPTDTVTWLYEYRVKNVALYWSRTLQRYVMIIDWETGTVYEHIYRGYIITGGSETLQPIFSYSSTVVRSYGFNESIQRFWLVVGPGGNDTHNFWTIDLDGNWADTAYTVPAGASGFHWDDTTLRHYLFYVVSKDYGDETEQYDFYTLSAYGSAYYKIASLRMHSVRFMHWNADLERVVIVDRRYCYTIDRNHAVTVGVLDDEDPIQYNYNYVDRYDDVSRMILEESYYSPQLRGYFFNTFSIAPRTGYYQARLGRFILTDPIESPTITTESLPIAAVGGVYSVFLIASSVLPVTWSATGLPAGLELNADTGEISGTAEEAGEYTVTITASNAVGSTEKSCTLTTNDDAPYITADTLPDATDGEEYSAALTASGLAPLTWSAEGLPEGLSIDTASGEISGIPIGAGLFSVTVTLSNSVSSDTKTFSLNVAASAVIAPEITTTELADACTQISYSAALTARGSDLVWSATGLPGGLTLNTATGAISGIPTTAGSYSVLFAVTNVNGTTEKTIELTVLEYEAPSLIPFSGDDTPALYVGVLCSWLPAEATGLPAPLWRVDNIPPGLTCDAATCLVSGTPAAVGEYRVVIRAYSQYTGDSSSTVRYWTINRLTAPTITTTGLRNATLDTNYVMQLTADSAVAVTWTASGLPAGLTCDAATGIISGIPTELGSSTVTVTAANSAGSVEKSYTLTVAEAAAQGTNYLESRMTPWNHTKSGVTINVDEAGEVTLDGTSTGQLNIILAPICAAEASRPVEWDAYEAWNDIPLEALVLSAENVSGTAVNSQGDSCNLTVRYSTTTVALNCKIGDGITSVEGTPTSALKQLVIFIRGGTVLNNLKFTPALRLKG